MNTQISTRSVRMSHPNGNSGGASIDGINYPPNADGTVSVPDGKPVQELLHLGYYIVEVTEPTITTEA